jgi:hypothetical protein
MGDSVMKRENLILAAQTGDQAAIFRFTRRLSGRCSSLCAPALPRQRRR